ncbi:MAG: FAD-dependent oxidoreductase [Candidatus Cohnella colombiensis]|uniref:Aerobic glycerol-3-phosphate dehydrogenase n=1 Tax=Candidatus Cohnella colombiensis TaxID=3121368 RepID=A0AA95JCK0_9BACL|nr:MAG: FAD-dependent oxidoreductase [Cohnella sp.]
MTNDNLINPINDGTFSSLNRAEKLRQAASNGIDLLVIGGGITGAGIALNAASRGIRTLVVEMQDFAAGTSSRSTKLVHGGLRYLKQFEIGVVAEVGKERAIVYENGPHVTTPEWMMLPFYRGGTFGPIMTSLGLRVYDFLAGVKRGERRLMFNTEQTLLKEPLLKREGLLGSGYYVEYRTDDARLTIEVMKKAVELGAISVNYAKVESFLYEGDQLIGASISDQISGEVYELKAPTIVNATGPWVDELRDKDGSKQGKTLRLTKGVHLVFDRSRFPLSQAVYFDTPDGRMVFAIPREGKTYFGTTDTNYTGDIAHPQVTEQDRSYLLNAVNQIFPSLKLVDPDIESSWAGLRPLIQQEGKDPSEISRRDEVFVSPTGLISIAGGKLTGYRKMAESVVQRVVERLAVKGITSNRSSDTKHIPISGGEVGGSEGFPKYVEARIAEGVAAGLSPESAERLARQYGSNASKLFRYAEDERVRKVAEQYEVVLDLAAELHYAIYEECVVKPADFWIRRTGKLFFNIAEVHQWSNAVHAMMAQLLGWNDSQSQQYREELVVFTYEASTAVH